MLCSNQQFNSKYLIFTMPRLWDTKQDEYDMLDESGVLSLAAYLFTQDISKYNRFGYKASTEYMISSVPDSCKVITIPNLFFMGYFPQVLITDRAVQNWWKIGNTKKFPYSTEGIEKEVLGLILQGKTDMEIINLISSDNYFSAEKLHDNIKRELHEYQIREDSVDIKMCDFLFENYANFLMFVTKNHPTRDVLIELSRRILKRLQIDDMDILCDQREVQPPCPQNLHWPIYPSVLKAFGFGERQYYFEASLYEWELPVLTDISEEINAMIEKNKGNTMNIFNVKLSLDFKTYMLVYIRCLRSIIHI